MSNENIKNANAQNSEETKKVTKCTLDIEPAEFDGQAKCLYMNTKELCDMIGSIFKPVMPDYSGCKIRINDGTEKYPVLGLLAPGELYVNVFFKQTTSNPDPKTSNVILAHGAPDGGNDMFKRMASVMGTNSRRIYALSDWTKEILLDFTHPYDPNPENYKKYMGFARWDQRIVEGAHPVTSLPGNANEVTVGVVGLPLLTFIYTLYGMEHKTSSGEKIMYDYAVTPLRKTLTSPYYSMNGVSNPGADEYVLQITQLDNKIKADVSRAIGYGYQDPLEYNVYNH